MMNEHMPEEVARRVWARWATDAPHGEIAGWLDLVGYRVTVDEVVAIAVSYARQREVRRGQTRVVRANGPDRSGSSVVRVVGDNRLVPAFRGYPPESSAQCLQQISAGSLGTCSGMLPASSGSIASMELRIGTRSGSMCAGGIHQGRPSCMVTCQPRRSNSRW
jgi:hypothetical protein